MPPAQDAPEQALIGLNRQATVARLLSGTVHEVNNALQVISGTVEVLELRTDLPAAVVEALARLRVQSTRAAGALGRVTSFTSTSPEATGPVNMRAVVEESLALRDYAIRRARLSARLDADRATAFVVTGSPGDLQQAVLNAIINAEQALAGRTGTILVRLAVEGDTVVARVIDDGPGIEPAAVPGVFEPFVSGGNPFETPGLGLWASRRLVERHGGTLTLEPRPGGTSLVLRLPIHRSS
jgi:two-component system NtrC family sensor kinase